MASKSKEQEYGDRDVTKGIRTDMPSSPNNLWTEISKDLVVKEAIEQLGYTFTQNENAYYVTKHLPYVSLTTLSTYQGV
jgi:hypothetical protein